MYLLSFDVEEWIFTLKKKLIFLSSSFLTISDILPYGYDTEISPSIWFHISIFMIY